LAIVIVLLYEYVMRHFNEHKAFTAFKGQHVLEFSFNPFWVGGACLGLAKKVLVGEHVTDVILR
jgi:hypothetical protein